LSFYQRRRTMGPVSAVVDATSPDHSASA
jgi:hypothetical protein